MTDLDPRLTREIYYFVQHPHTPRVRGVIPIERFSIRQIPLVAIYPVKDIKDIKMAWIPHRRMADRKPTPQFTTVLRQLENFQSFQLFLERQFRTCPASLVSSSFVD